MIRFPFSYVQGTDGVFREHVVRLKPEQEVRGHPLGPACLALSHHHLWLASVGQDGLLCVRETASMVDRLTYFFKTLLQKHTCVCLLSAACDTVVLQDQFIQLQCHPYGSGSVRSVLFSADSQTLLTVGLDDGSIVCSHLR